MNPWEEDYGDVATATEAPPWEAEFQTTEDGGQRTDTPIPTGDQLSQYDPPNAASRALEAARQYLSPILGRTAQQQMAEGPRDTEGLLPAASKPIIPLPKFTHAAGDSKAMAVGKAIGNTALGFAEFFESPLGLATMGTAAIPNAGRIVAGAFAADLGSKLPEAYTTTKQTVANPNASFGEKAEAVIGTTTQAGLVGLTARHAAKGRTVNTEAAALEREIKAETPNTKTQTPNAEAQVSGLKSQPSSKPWEMEYAGGEMPRGSEIADRSAPVPEARRSTVGPVKATEPAAAGPVDTAALRPEPKPLEMEYAGGEMPRETSKFTEFTTPEVSTTGRGVAQAAPASSPGKSEKPSQTITGSKVQTGTEMPVQAKPGEANLTQGRKAAKVGSESANVGSGGANGGSKNANGGIESANGENIVARGPVFERVDVDHGTRQTEFRVRRVTDKERNERWEMFGYTPWVVERRTIRTKDGVRESGEHEQWLTFAKGETKQKAIDDGIADTSFRDAESVDAVHAKVSATRKAEALYAADKAKRLKESEAEVRYAENAINALRDEANKKYQTALKRAKIYDVAMAGKADASKVEAIRAKLKPEFQKRADELKEDYERRKAKTKAIQDEKPPDFAKVGLEVAKVGLESAKGERANQSLEGWADKVLSQDPRKRTRMGLDPAEEARRLAAVAIKGSYLIARGVRDFAQWVKEITAQIPELAAKSEAELRRIYAQAVDIAEGRDPVIGDSVRGMKIKADTSLSDQVRENTEAAYTKRVSANDIAEAQRLIREAGGPEAAANDILTGLWKPVDVTVQVKGAGEVLAGLAQLEKAAGGNSARANELADLQVRVAEFSTRNATTPAQWLQAYNSLYANYSPAAWLKEWRAAVAKARRERVERATGQPVGESPTEIAQGIADGVAEGVRPDAPTTAKVIEEVFGTKKPGTAGGGQKPETTTEAVERIIGHKGEQAQRTAKKIQDFYEREVNKFKRKHKIPELSPEDQRSILAEAKAIERLPAESLQRREAVLRLLDQLHRRKGFEWWELPLSFWYAHTLSGPTTHAKNILGNGVNLGMEAGMQALLKPTNIPIILESLGRSLSVGAKEAASILRTGHDTSARHGDKFELRRNVMELQNGTLDKVLLPWKLVGRFLRAEDAVFFNAGQELRAAILSKRANGESTAAARKAMGWTPEARTAAEAQAASEGMSGLNYSRRVNEIIEQGRAEDVMNAAREFGYDVTFNNEPYGVLGAFTSAINRGFEAAPVFKPFILPFTRIVANVSNSSLNWTPVGNYRALRAQRKLAWLGRAENSGKLYGRAINDPLAIRDAHARALLGTAAIVGITAAAVKNVFDDNPQFMVTGSGPTNLDQRKALRAAGWIPYSVKVGDKYISYADKPPQLAMAMVGHYLDAIRYKNLDREDALNRVTYALNGSFGVLLQSSWLQGLSSLFNQANRESTKNFTQGMTAQAIKTGSGVFVPAALRQLDQFFDPKRYSPDDVQGMLLAQIPWARRNGHPDLNAFGQPVSSPTSKIFWSQVEGDALVRRLAGQRVFPGVPAEGDLTPEEHYALVKYRGPILREMLATQADEWAGAPRLIAQDIVNRISSAATAQAKADLGLDEANNERRMQRKLTTK